LHANKKGPALQGGLGLSDKIYSQHTPSRPGSEAEKESKKVKAKVCVESSVHWAILWIIEDYKTYR